MGARYANVRWTFDRRPALAGHSQEGITTPPYGHPSQEGNTAAAENVRLCERSEAIQRNGVPLAMYKLQITLYKEVLVALF